MEALHGSQFFKQHPLAPAQGFSMSCRWVSATPLASIHCITWSTSSSSFNLGVYRVILSHILTFLFCLLLCSFLLFLEYFVIEMLPMSPIGSALASGRSVLEPAVNGSVKHGGSSSCLHTEATSVGLSLPKPYCADPYIPIKRSKPSSGTTK